MIIRAGRQRLEAPGVVLPQRVPVKERTASRSASSRIGAALPTVAGGKGEGTGRKGEGTGIKGRGLDGKANCGGTNQCRASQAARCFGAAQKVAGSKRGGEAAGRQVYLRYTAKASTARLSLPPAVQQQLTENITKWSLA